MRMLTHVQGKRKNLYPLLAQTILNIGKLGIFTGKLKFRGRGPSISIEAKLNSDNDISYIIEENNLKWEVEGIAKNNKHRDDNRGRPHFIDDKIFDERNKRYIRVVFWITELDSYTKELGLSCEVNLNDPYWEE